ncbi:MAG: MBL fold metallo-hydrolase [Candidatus Liptonbacteria bacterium]|nr:MBL fold metallo-hydrolase [Candidatus Liptonbacteria bacterium]
MIIKWYGDGCYKIETPNFNLVVDPDTSIKGKQIKADLVLKTLMPLPVKITSSNEIIGSGEYEVSGIKIQGIALPVEKNADALKTIYLVMIDEIRLCFLGDTEKDLTEGVLENIGEVDILFAPTNQRISYYLKSIDPKIIIPGFGDPHKAESELGQKGELQEKLVIKKKDLEGEIINKLIILKS